MECSTRTASRPATAMSSSSPPKPMVRSRPVLRNRSAEGDFASDSRIRFDERLNPYASVAFLAGANLTKSRATEVFRVRLRSMKPSLALCLLLAPPLHAASPIKALIVDGQNNHKWQLTTPVLKKDLESTGKFQVDVATSPPKGADMSGFKPNFSAYKVVVSN